MHIVVHAVGAFEDYQDVVFGFRDGAASKYFFAAVYTRASWINTVVSLHSPIINVNNIRLQCLFYL